MLVREIKVNEKEFFNRIAVHPMQTWEWGEFREKTGLDVVRIGQFDGEELAKTFLVTFHKVPKFNYTIGYIPRSLMPDKQVLEALAEIGKSKNTIFYKLEPNIFEPVENKGEKVLKKAKEEMVKNGCRPGRIFFAKYSFMIDLVKSEEQLLASMKSKTRYNTRLAERKGVKVTEDNSEQAFQDYLRLTFKDTTLRQNFYAHDENYHRKMWEAMRGANFGHLFKASFDNETLVTWILFNFNKVLYYPYGASSSKMRNLMASNLMMWEAIKLGKKMGCKYFDLWGSLGPNPDPKNPWIGFHKFKEGYGSTLMEFMGTYDYVLDEGKYNLYLKADKLRWKLLKLKKMFRL